MNVHDLWRSISAATRFRARWLSTPSLEPISGHAPGNRVDASVPPCGGGCERHTRPGAATGRGRRRERCARQGSRRRRSPYTPGLAGQTQFLWSRTSRRRRARVRRTHRSGSRSVERRSQNHFSRALGAAHLDTGFVRRTVICGSGSRRKAASRSRTRTRLQRRGGLRTSGAAADRSLAAYLERAYNHSKYGEYSPAPAMEITVPTMNDPDSAPAGKHVLSAIVSTCLMRSRRVGQRAGSLHGSLHRGVGKARLPVSARASSARNC